MASIIDAFYKNAWRTRINKKWKTELEKGDRKHYIQCFDYWDFKAYTIEELKTILTNITSTITAMQKGVILYSDSEEYLRKQAALSHDFSKLRLHELENLKTKITEELDSKLNYLKHNWLDEQGKLIKPFEDHTLIEADYIDLFDNPGSRLGRVYSTGFGNINICWSFKPGDKNFSNSYSYYDFYLLPKNLDSNYTGNSLKLENAKRKSLTQGSIWVKDIYIPQNKFTWITKRDSKDYKYTKIWNKAFICHKDQIEYEHEFLGWEPLKEKYL